ncbi:MAG: hypothetical protein J6I64_07815 [Lachnospiraceae bacterium]|nr:hypothetical protein [Lachnospiraceae bacterium]
MTKPKYTFSLVSLGILVLELGLIGFCLYRAILSVGSSGLWLGCLGLLTMLLGFLGFRAAWMDRELLGKNLIFPYLMMILHAMVLVVLVAVYMLGLM